MAATQTITTAEQLLRTPGLGRCELVRGELIMMSPGGAEHGGIIVNVTVLLGSFVKQRRLGKLFGAETGFRIAHDPDTVRAPDVAFVRADRIPAAPVKGFFPGPPDLAVEVLSPDDRASEVLDKVRDWLQAGCLAVWIVDPRTRRISIYRRSNQITELGADDVLSGEDLLPGFSIAVAEIFAE
jgi:Uma2 family endonuclease